MFKRFLRGDFARHGAIVFTSSMIVNALNYVFHVLMTRRLGVDSYGELYSLLAALTLCSVPTTVLTMVVVRYAAEFRALDDRSRLGALAVWILRNTAIAAAAILALGFGLQSPIAAYLHLPESHAVVATAAVLALSVIGPVTRGVLQGVQDFSQFAISTLIDGVGRVGLGVAFVDAGFGVNGALLGQACAMGLGLAYTWFALRRQLALVAAPLHLGLHRLVETTAGTTTAVLALSALGSVDLLLVKHFFSTHEAGLYSAVSLVGKVLLFTVGFLPAIILPKAAARVTRGESPVRLIAQASVALVVLSGVGLIVLYFMPALVIRMMAGAAFLNATPYVFSYGVAMSMLGAVTIVVNYKIGLHRFDFLAPLVAIAVLELVAISVLHATLWDVIHILLIGHTLAFATSLYRLTSIETVTQRQQAADVA